MNEEMKQVVDEIKTGVAEQVTKTVAETVTPAITKDVMEQLKAELVDRKDLFGGESTNAEAKQIKEEKERIAGTIKALHAGDFTQVKALSTGVATDGGYLVPEIWASEIIRMAPQYGVVRRQARQYGVSSVGHKTHLPTIGSVSVSRVGEGQPIPATKPTTGQLDIDIKKLAAIIPFTNELLKDANVDLVNILTALTAEAFAKAEDTWGFSGLATGEGIFQNASVPALTLATGKTTYAQAGLDDLLNMLDLLDESAIDGAKWYMSFSMFNALRKIKDTTGQYIIQQPTLGQPATIWNIPIQVVRGLPRTSDGSQANKKFIALGDLNYMLFADKKEYSLELLREATITDTDGTTKINLAEQDMSAIRVIERLDIQLAEPAKAFATIKTSAT